MASNLKLENFSDRELIHIVNDLAIEDDWVSVETIATRLGLAVEGMSEAQLRLHARRCVTVRLSWIKRLSGCLEKHPKEPGLWRLTVLGEQLVKAKAAKVVLDGLGQMGEFSTLLALDTISRRYRKANTLSANLMRREWAHGTHRKRMRA